MRRPTPPAGLAKAAGTCTLLIAGIAAPAHATQYDCVDERGTHHRMPHRIDTELIRFDCTEVADTVRPPERLAPVPRRYSSVMLTEDGEGGAVPASGPWPRALPLRGAPAAVASALQALSGPLDAMIHAVALEFGHDPDLLRAIVKVESGFNARAVSPKGAMGLMQLMPATARRFGLTESVSLFTPGVNLQIGARYLAYLKQLFPRIPELIIAAYNAGEGAVMKRNNRIPPFPETQSYVKQVLAAYEGFRARRGAGKG